MSRPKIIEKIGTERWACESASLNLEDNAKYIAKPMSSRGMSCVSRRVFITCTHKVPAAAPVKVQVMAGSICEGDTNPLRMNVLAAAPLPKLLCNLFVASASVGGTPASSKAGREIRPPPPAMLSTKPLKNAAKTKRQ